MHPKSRGLGGGWEKDAKRAGSMTGAHACGKSKAKLANQGCSMRTPYQGGKTRLVNRQLQGAPRPRKPASRLRQLRGMWSGGWNGTETPPRPLCFHASLNDRGGKFTSGEGVAFSGVQLDTSRGATHQAAPFLSPVFSPLLSHPLPPRQHSPGRKPSSASGQPRTSWVAGPPVPQHRAPGELPFCQSESLERPAAHGAPHSPPAGLARPSTRAPCLSGPPGSRER